MGRRIKSEKHETHLFLLFPKSAIAEIMIVFIISSYDEAQDANFVFHQRSSDAMRLFCTTTCRQARWTRWSLLQVQFYSKGNLQFWYSRKRLQATELTCAYQATRRTLTTERERRHSTSHFEFDDTSLKVSKQIDCDRWFDQELFPE